MRDRVRDGALLGVWGADGPEPLEWAEAAGGGATLTGAKRYASGLGHLDLALVTARAAPGEPERMFLVPAGDPARHDPGAWTASAMRATRSGGFDATGLAVGEASCIGDAGDLMVEPWFEGGVWRYCAAHVGGAEGLIDRWTEMLRRMGRLDDPVQRDRLGRAMAEAIAARAVVEAAAEGIEAASEATPDVVERAVAHVLLAREAVEGACIRILALSERALGMAAHDVRGPVDGMRRDLSLFLRQAAPDAKLDRALRTVLPTGLGELR
jgi:alkylation response protein AidB-like acyl-CoA dehydrogenase